MEEFGQIYKRESEKGALIKVLVEANKNQNKKQEHEAMDLKDLETKIEKMQKDNEAQAKATKEQIEKLQKENKELKDSKEASEKKLTEFTSGKRSGEITAFVDKQIEEGKVLPANKESTVSVLQSLSDEKTLKFKKGDVEEPISPRELHQKGIESNPDIVKLEKETTMKTKEGGKGSKIEEELKTFKKSDESDSTEDEQKLDHIVKERISKFTKDNPDKTIEYDIVLNQVCNDYPELEI